MRSPFRPLEVPDPGILDDHRALLDAIESADAERFDTLLAGHLVATPNSGELARILGEDEVDDVAGDRRVGQGSGGPVTGQVVEAHALQCGRVGAARREVFHNGPAQSTRWVV